MSKRVQLNHFLFFVITCLLIQACTGAQNRNSSSGDEIQPYYANPAFWQYKGKPVLLLGASSDHNIFLHEADNLEEELDKLMEHGGNFLRNTLSFRGAEDVFAYWLDPETQLFDLNRFNDEYWQKLDYFLQTTHKRGIIVQLEVWETYDFYSRVHHIKEGKTAWERNPFNPANNINYQMSESGLSVLFQSHGQSLINPFFNTTIPIKEPFDFENKPLLLGFQQQFVDKMLSITFNYDHILYCIDNETQADPQWSLYWATYINKTALKKNRNIYVTEMFDPFDPSGGAVAGAKMQSPSTHFFTMRSNVNVTLENPHIFSFVDISNHNAQEGETHYQTGLYVWKRIQESGIIRPLNNVKIYGASGGTWNGNGEEGLQRFWRNIFSGAAAARFHRQPTGWGNSPIALNHVKSMRMISDSVDIFSTRPSNHLLSDREENEAYCLANNKGEYILYFPEGGEVLLNVKSGDYQIQWLEIISSVWQESYKAKFPATMKTPDEGMWAVKVVKKI